MAVMPPARLKKKKPSVYAMTVGLTTQPTLPLDVSVIDINKMFFLINTILIELVQIQAIT